MKEMRYGFCQNVSAAILALKQLCSFGNRSSAWAYCQLPNPPSYTKRRPTMNAKPPDLTPEQHFWGCFYRLLHDEAEKIRKATAESLAVSQATEDEMTEAGPTDQKVNRQFDSS
jgi:hypothetical protein